MQRLPLNTTSFQLPDDYLPLQTKLKTADVIKNLKFFNLEINQKNIDHCKNKMFSVKSNIRSTISNLLYKYWVDIGQQVRMTVPSEGNRPIRKVSCFLNSINSITTLEEAKKVNIL